MPVAPKRLLAKSAFRTTLHKDVPLLWDIRRHKRQKPVQRRNIHDHPDADEDEVDDFLPGHPLLGSTASAPLT